MKEHALWAQSLWRSKSLAKWNSACSLLYPLSAMVVKEIIHPLFLLFASERSAEARILNCCHQAEWNGRTYDVSQGR